MEGHFDVGVALGVQVEFAVLDEVRGEFGDVHHFVDRGVLEAGAGDGGYRLFQEVHRLSIPGGHILVAHPPHVAALAAQDPLHSQALGFGVHLGVEALAHLVGDEPAEVAPLRGVGAQRIVQADVFEQEQVAHHGVGAGVGEVVAGRHDKEDLGALAVV